MSKVIYVISKKEFGIKISSKLEAICERLSPDNITPRPPLIKVEGNKVAYGVMNPTDSILTKEASLLLGRLFENGNDWNVVGKEFPDGAYALFRNQEDKFEIISDYSGSRTIWYYVDDEQFVCSTSQRAIIMYLGNFEFNEAVIPWMLSCGNLGPLLSWDKRIHQLELNSSVTLDKSTWKLSIKKVPIDFKINHSDEISHEDALRNALDETFKYLNLDFTKWALPLSGGYDSRGMLSLILKNTKHEGLSTLTWGLKSSINEKGNDAYVAKKLADYQQVPHKYFHTDLSNEKLDITIDRFLKLGEGRTDHIRGYLDGFKLFKSLFEDNIQGIIRGDECFEATNESSDFTTRMVTGSILCEDLTNLKEYKKYGMVHQEFPAHLKRGENENLSEWGHRLYWEFRLPTVNAALNDLKVPYVEIINPLLSKKILNAVTESPLHYRKDKKLIIKIIKSISPPVEIAKKDAIASPTQILEDKQFLNILQQKLSERKSGELFNPEFLLQVQEGLASVIASKPSLAKKMSLKSRIKGITPRFVKNLYLDKVMTRTLPHSSLAFRSYIVVRMNEILTEDSLILNDKTS